ncbi:Mechanosensitive ion channel protein 10 [Hibiscus syriacus]|uniref:Mechanosensitive ion channel protein 10 n=1 Tax=Hibiscus syriacus TaxID=106335 RepID=A0A6A2Y148_HIBSY|nr:Mechanosensitive ion channel protein 10 [Hibiscus syriacus]
MAEKRSSGGGGEVVINVHSEENPEVLKGSAPIEIEALDPQQNAHVSPTKFGPTLDKVSIEKGKWRNKKLKGVVIEWFIFLLLLGCLIACLTVDNLQNIHFWGLKTWKWCVLVIVIFSESVQVFIWLSSILVTWVLFFLDVKRSKTTTKIVDNVTWVLVLVDAITNSGISTISYSFDENTYEEGGELADKEITNEEEAIYVAYQIFNNITRGHSRYFDGDDLLRFMIKEEVELVFPLFEGSHAGKIDRNSLTNWVVKVYRERKGLANTLSDTNIVVDQLNKLVKAILIVVTFIIWLLLVGTATTRVLLVIAAFLFAETSKTIFQVVIFIFVMHPFDVGDRCVVDGVQLVVEEINIFTTTFLKLNNEKVYYPNSVLFSKPISNYYRSPDMGEVIEFCIDFRTPAEAIAILKDKIRKHLEASVIWHPNHLVAVTEIENDKKLKMALHCNHTMNFQDFRERNRRRTDLIIELKRIMEELGIRYDLLPEQGNPNQDTRDKPDATAYAAPDL